MIRRLTFLLALLTVVGNVFSQTNTINVIPYPQSVKLGDGQFRISSTFAVEVSSSFDDKIFEDGVNRFLKRLNSRTLSYFQEEKATFNKSFNKSALLIKVSTKANTLIGEDESYVLSIKPNQIVLTANTTVGAIRGLETLSQMVSADEYGYFIPVSEIIDAPRFKWRGIMVDVARHFIPIPLLKKHIDAMSMVKLNVLHLHLTDDEGFRVESKIYPKLHKEGSNGRFYTQEELRGLVHYASERAIIIVPEFDIPAHTRSWFAGHPELASQPGPYRPGPRFTFAPGEDAMETVMNGITPTIDPSREEVYEFLDRFIEEMTSIFPGPYLHIGADENNGAAWKNNPNIVQFMDEKGMKNTHELQIYFINRLYEITKKHERIMIGWQEAYTAALPKDIILQAWITEESFMKAVPPLEIAEMGNAVLISTGFYMDLFLPSHVHYINPNIPNQTNSNVWGGEAALWAEVVDENSFEGRAWPRAASIAERLWSPSNVTDIEDMYRRLYILSDRLEEAGLNHRLNIRRMLSQLANGTDIEVTLSILEILSPAKGYIRLGASMMQAPNLKFESTPLVNISDMVEIDSEEEWRFRKQIALYLKSNDATVKEEIKEKLKKWKKASLQLSKQIKSAPNLKVLEPYALKISIAVDIGLIALEKEMSQNEKTKFLKQLGELKTQTNIVEIRILDEIEALVTGKLAKLSTKFSMF